MEDSKENRINIEDLQQPEVELTSEEAQDVKGGIGLLVPAVQKVREAAAKSDTTEASLKISE